jgi:hypothetical protein
LEGPSCKLEAWHFSKEGNSVGTAGPSSLSPDGAGAGGQGSRQAALENSVGHVAATAIFPHRHLPPATESINHTHGSRASLSRLNGSNRGR